MFCPITMSTLTGFHSFLLLPVIILVLSLLGLTTCCCPRLPVTKCGDWTPVKDMHSGFNNFSFSSVNDNTSVNRFIETQMCPWEYDNFLCWPPVHAGQKAKLSCSKLPEIPDMFDPKEFASKECRNDSTWSSTTYYTCFVGSCEHSASQNKRLVMVVRVVGFVLSWIALVAALAIFFYVRSLKYLRNQLHCNLVLTFIMRGIFWFVVNDYTERHYKQLSLSLIPQSEISPEECHIQKMCRFLSMMQYFFLLTNFFWMFCEGLYLHLVVVWAFTIKRLRLWHFLCIGWGLPVVIIILLLVVKLFTAPIRRSYHELCWDTDSKFMVIIAIPVYGVLALNLVFLASIIWTLFTKLRATHTQQSVQYRKMTWATLMLIPLLGINQVISSLPIDRCTRDSLAFTVSNAILNSTQGFFVAVFFCFLNSEVRGSLGRRYSQWKQTRSLYVDIRQRSRRHKSILSLKERPSQNPESNHVNSNNKVHASSVNSPLLEYKNIHVLPVDGQKVSFGGNPICEKNGGVGGLAAGETEMEIHFETGVTVLRNDFGDGDEFDNGKKE